MNLRPAIVAAMYEPGLVFHTLLWLMDTDPVLYARDSYLLLYEIYSSLHWFGTASPERTTKAKVRPWTLTLMKCTIDRHTAPNRIYENHHRVMNKFPLDSRDASGGRSSG